MKHPIKFITTVVIFLLAGIRSNSQTAQPVPPIPEDFKKSNISQQLNTVEAHTRIYENFRAVREDVFQLLSRNIKDTLASANKKISSNMAEIALLKSHIDSLNNSLQSTKSSLDDMTQSKNSMSLLGLRLSKATYNSIMWSILGIAILLLVIGYMIFNKNATSTLKAKKELADLQKEFEEYKQRKRIEHENMTMAHFNEIKKLKEEASRRL